MTAEDLETADVVISMGCDLKGLPAPRGTLLKWDDVPGPGEDFAGADAAIRQRVMNLVDELIRQRDGGELLIPMTILKAGVQFWGVRAEKSAGSGHFKGIRHGFALALGGDVSTANRVLIVEDDANALSGYVEFLTAAGFEPTGVANGADALPLALRNPPAAVVTDITLPGMSGFQLAAALRRDSRTRSIPIIGLTAHWAADVHSRARDVAMQVILSKPCIPGHLVAELERVLGRAKALAEVTTPRARTALTFADLHDDPASVRAHRAS